MLGLGVGLGVVCAARVTQSSSGARTVQGVALAVQVGVHVARCVCFSDEVCSSNKIDNNWVKSKPTGIFNCSALPLRGTSCPLDTGRLVIYYPHAIGLQVASNIF